MSWRRVILLLFSLLLVGCNILGEEDSPTRGEIVVYTAVLHDGQRENDLAAFRAEYPNIEVHLVLGSTGPIMQKLFSEKDRPVADVVWGVSASSLLRAEWKDILQPYSPKGLKRVDSDFRDPANPPHWVGIDVWMSAFCVNTDLMTKLELPMPESWDDLLDPVYKNHIVMPNPSSSGTGYFSVSSIFQLNGKDETAAWQYLDQLHENIAQYTRSGRKPCQLAAAGEYPIGISFGSQGVVQLKEGRAIKVIFPKEGSGWDIEANALVRKSKIKLAAQTFLDWAISDRAMQAYAENFAVTSVETDVPVPEGFPSDPAAQLIENDIPWAAANKKHILDRWLSRYNDKSEQ